jgi:hypothetical protein
MRCALAEWQYNCQPSENDIALNRHALGRLRRLQLQTKR